MSLIEDPVASAKLAGLRYVSDAVPGITRQRKGKGFVYLSPAGRPIRDFQELTRIRALAIPPAWRTVWICPDARGHLQATGLDDRGRKQYRYHPEWRAVRDQTKYEKMIPFAKALPRIRRAVDRHLSLPGLPRQKVLATVVKLLGTTFMRVGNDEYARANGSYGLTTMQNKHVKVRGSEIQFQFRGKSGIEHAIGLEDARLARIIRNCQDLPGEELFAYVDADGQVRDVHSEDVNDYLREISGEDFTAKDFRTWAGTVLAGMALNLSGPCSSQRRMKSTIVTCVKAVAQRLRNTPAVCRKCYIHPAIFAAYEGGSLRRTFSRSHRQHLGRKYALSTDEQAVLAILQRKITTSR